MRVSEQSCWQQSSPHPSLVCKWWKIKELLFDGDRAGGAWEYLQLHWTDHRMMTMFYIKGIWVVQGKTQISTVLCTWDACSTNPIRVL